MTLKVKLLVIGLVCLGLGSLIVHYQIYRHQNHQQLATFQKTELRSAEWVAELLEQKVSQLESSVSYLDKSTIESLRRLGIRYFVYAYQHKDDWRLKWKLIDGATEQSLLSEVNTVVFSDLPKDARSWIETSNQGIILTTPARLSDSLQLKEGFLVFGLSPQFFSFVESRDQTAQIMTIAGRELFRSSTQAPIEGSWVEEATSSLAAKTLYADHQALSVYFSPKAQVWIARVSPRMASGFLGGSQGKYFLISTFFIMSLYTMLLVLWPMASEAKSELKPTQPESEKSGIESESDTLGQPILAEEILSHVDLSQLVSGVLADEQERLSALQIEVKSQIAPAVIGETSAPHLRDLLQRLIGNSALVLEEESEKRIEIQVADHGEQVQIIYLDSRSRQFPEAGASLLLQTEGSLTGIDGILAYASWYFGEQMVLAKKGFCLSLNIPRAEGEATQRPAETVKPQPTSTVVVAPQIEKHEPLNLSSVDDEEFSQFSLGDLNFIADQFKDEIAHDAGDDEMMDQFKPIDSNNGLSAKVSDAQADLDEKGLFEFTGGDFKIKIRAPKKRDMDVNS